MTALPLDRVLTDTLKPAMLFGDFLEGF